MKGVYKHDGDRFRVRKYDRHVGIFDTLEAAVTAARKADEQELVNKHMQNYMHSKRWLQDRNLLPKDKQ